MDHVTPDYGTNLLPQHAAMLAASAVSVEMAQARGYRSVDTKARLESLGFTRQQRNVPGLLVPVRDADGTCVGFQYRPDEPRVTDRGRAVKYETPPGQRNRLDVPLSVGPLLGDPTVDLWVTEGARKADAAAGLGLACISLSGVWNWRGSNEHGGKTALSDWNDVALNDRQVVLAFDSDVATKPSVGKALAALADYLTSKGARVEICHLPDSGNGKTGLDDFIAAGHDLDELVALVGPATAAAPTPAKDTIARALVVLALGRYRLGLAEDDQPFAVPMTGPRLVRPLRGGKHSLRPVHAAAYYDETGRVAPQQAITDALQILEGQAVRLEGEELHLRTARVGDPLYLDLGDSTGRAVELTAAGWQLVGCPPVLFRRTALTGALPAPDKSGELAELWQLLNIGRRDRPLVLAWLVAALLPDVPHPVLALRGEQGSGKSTASRILAGLLDPSPAQIRKPPRDGEGWVTAAAGSWVVAVDNVSHIPDWWSDALCRAVTGDGDVRRRLYSDADLVVFSFRRVLLLNSIDLGEVRDDLMDRLLTIEVQRVGARGRRLDAEIEAEWTDRHPRILGALLDLACRVLSVLPTLRLDELPRMADFGRVLAGVDHVLGTDGLAVYGGQASDLAADAVNSDPVLLAIMAVVCEPWSGSAAQLLALIQPPDTQQRAAKDWPKDARALTALLRRRAPSLRRRGWTVEELGRGGRDNLLRFSLVPPCGGDGAGDSDLLRATYPVERATGDADARPVEGPGPARTPVTVPEAGDTGESPAASLATSEPRVEGRATDAGLAASRRGIDGPSPASPASPASYDTRGPCRLGCGRSVVLYGEQADPICGSCRRNGDVPVSAAGSRDLAGGVR